MNRDIAIANLKEIIALEGDPELKRQLQGPSRRGLSGLSGIRQRHRSLKAKACRSEECEKNPNALACALFRHRRFP